jgi:hypothetical protein
MMRFARIIGTTALLCGAFLGIIACGFSSSVSGGGSSTTAVAPTATTAPTSAPTNTSVPPTATTAAPVACGNIDESLAGLTPANYGSITQCFANLFAHCQAGTMNYTNSGIDSHHDYIFTTVANGGGCSIKVSDHFQVASGSTPTNTTTTYTCGSVTFSSNKDLFAGCANTPSSISVPS